MIFWGEVHMEWEAGLCRGGRKCILLLLCAICIYTALVLTHVQRQRLC